MTITPALDPELTATLRRPSSANLSTLFLSA